jgi:hypothetical protein
MMSLRGRGGDRQAARQPDSDNGRADRVTCFFIFYVATVKEKTKFLLCMF